MEKFRKSLAAWIAAISIQLPFSLYAGGVYLYEISSADTRLASAGWSARAEDPSTVFTNPAGMTRLYGDQVELGAQAIFTHFHFDPDSDTNVCGDKGRADAWLPSGSFFYVHQYNECLSLGVGSFGYFGADLGYNHDWVGRYYVQRVMLEGLSTVASAAYRLNDQWSIGAGVNVMYGIFHQRAAVNNFLDGIPDGYLQAKDRHFGFGGVFGILYEPSCCTRFGLQYVTPVKLNFHTRPRFENIGPALEDFLELAGFLGSTLDLHIKVPQSVMFSAYHCLCPCWAIMGNIGWQQWSSFQDVNITLADPNQKSLNIQSKYKDCWHIAIGLESKFNESLILSSGIAYDSSIVSTRNRVPGFPVGHQWRVGTGARWYYSRDLVFDFCSELQWQGDLDLDVNLGPIAGEVSGTYKNTYVLFLNINMSYVF